jgi:hypothetical protein
MVDKLSSVATETVEVLITPGCRMIGRSLGSLRLRRRYGVYPLAVHRRDQNIGRQLDDLVVVVGDTLLLEGAPEDIQRLAADMDLVDIARPTEKAYRRGHAPIAIGALDRGRGARPPRRGADPRLRGDRRGGDPPDPLHRFRRGASPSWTDGSSRSSSRCWWWGRGSTSRARRGFS